VKVFQLSYDVAIVGMGAAGLQAAISSSRKKAKTIVMGRSEDSALHGAEVENYFGVLRATGKELLNIGMEQARSFGAKLLQEDIIEMSSSEGAFRLLSDSGTEIEAKAVVIASGIMRKKLKIPGEKELFGKGVSYCASCDCNFYKGRPVAVIGAGSEAAVSAELMTHYASKVYWVAEEVDASENLREKALNAGAEPVSSPPKEIIGDDKVSALVLEDGSELEVNGVFIELGARSTTDMAMDLGVMPTPDGEINVDKDFSAGVEGVYACGDITGKPWQVAKAAGEGGVAGEMAAKYARGL